MGVCACVRVWWCLCVYTKHQVDFGQDRLHVCLDQTSSRLGQDRRRPQQGKVCPLVPQTSDVFVCAVGSCSSRWSPLLASGALLRASLLFISRTSLMLYTTPHSLHPALLLISKAPPPISKRSLCSGSPGHRASSSTADGQRKKPRRSQSPALIRYI